MVSVLHVEQLDGWLKELSDTKVYPLKELVTFKKDGAAALAPNKLPGVGGVYAFWWIGNITRLKDEAPNRVLKFKGPNNREVYIEFSHEWIGDNIPVPLYIGKTADSIKKRVGSHLRLKEKRFIKLGHEGLADKRPSTLCQLKDKLERIFLHHEDIRSLMVDNIGLSYIELNGDEHCVDRFYLEDLAIGRLRPLFNIDIER